MSSTWRDMHGEEARPRLSHWWCAKCKKRLVDFEVADAEPGKFTCKKCGGKVTEVKRSS